MPSLGNKIDTFALYKRYEITCRYARRSRWSIEQGSLIYGQDMFI